LGQCFDIPNDCPVFVESGIFVGKTKGRLAREGQPVQARNSTESSERSLFQSHLWIGMCPSCGMTLIFKEF
jgi:hypothetical protein